MADTHANAGEAGQQGQDRQPVKNPGKKVSGPAPEGGDIARASQVDERSHQARTGMKGGADGKDHLDPGPAREEAEKSKGTHHPQEREPEMAKKVEKL